MIRLVQTPARWKTASLGDVCRIQGGVPAPQDEMAFENGEIPFVRMKDVGRHHLTNNLHETDQRLNKAYFESAGFEVTPRGSVLMPRSGSVGLNHRAILTVDAVIVSHLCALIPISREISVDFLYRFLSRVDMRKLTKKTTGLDSIAFSDLRLVAVPLPPLSDQERIAKVLDRAEALRETRNLALARLDSLLQSVFLQMFGDPTTNSKKWTRKTMGEIGEVITGNTPPRSNGSLYGTAIEWIKSDNLNTPNHYLTQAEEGLSAKGKRLARIAPQGSVLVTC